MGTPPGFPSTNDGAIISQIERFLLEMGKGFLFEPGRKRFSFDDDHFSSDLGFPKRPNIHAREYQLYLPSKEELQKKLSNGPERRRMRESREGDSGGGGEPFGRQKLAALVSGLLVRFSRISSLGSGSRFRQTAAARSRGRASSSQARVRHSLMAPTTMSRRSTSPLRVLRQKVPVSPQLLGLFDGFLFVERESLRL